MDNRTLFRTGIVGLVLSIACCATPVLVVLLGILGFSAWVGWLDYILIPAVLLFFGITIYALYHRKNASACSAVNCGRNQNKGCTK